MVHILLLGTFQLERDGKIIRLPTRKAESLLAYLALYPTLHTREKLATIFWGDVPDAQARASLRNILPILRKQLGNDALSIDRESVQLNPGSSIWIDAAEFKAQAVAIQTASIPDPTAINIELYRGDLLAGFNDEWNEWISSEREALQAAFVNAALRISQQLQTQGRFAHAIDVAQKITTVEPACEPAYRQMMAAYFAMGDRDTALKQYERCVRLLWDELAVEPSNETVALYQQIRQAQSAPLNSAVLTNLPVPLTSFIGREREVESVKQLLLSHQNGKGMRLLTLSGPGGAGKTRLAIRVAGELVSHFADRASWVELAALGDPALVPSAVAKVLGLRELSGQPILETLVAHLRPREMLLVLDNCEHLLLPVAQLINALLEACPFLQVLCTSREMLGLTGEAVYWVPSLTLEEDTSVSEAARLFVERATAVSPVFRLMPENAAVVTHICRQLDGIPLAIELAAARVKVLPVEQIAERLDDRFNLLTGGSRAALPRHQTLRAAIDWSYDLLNKDEQTFFRQVSVFAGGFSLEAIEAVTMAGSPVLDTLARLVDKSLIIADNGRYRLLETIRQYAADKLWLAGEEADAKLAHLKWSASMTGQAGLEMQSAKQNEWFDRLEKEHDNIRAALNYAVEGTGPYVQQALNICGDLWFFWGSRGYVTEARERLTKLLARPEAVHRTEARAKAVLAAGGLAIRQADFGSARPLFAESLEIWRVVGNLAGIASALHYCGWAANALGDFEAAQLAYEESLAIRRRLGPNHLREVADSLVNLGMLAFTQKDYASAWALQQEGVNIQRETGELWGLAYSLYQLGNTGIALGHYGQARTFLDEGVTVAQSLKDQIILIYLLEAFACLAAATGEVEHAARLFGAAEARREAIRSPIPPQWRAYCGRIIGEMRANSDTLVTVAWTEGRAIGIDEAVAKALGR